MLADPRYFLRYKAIITGLARHGFQDLVDTLGLSRRRFWLRRGARAEPAADDALPARPQRVRRLLEELGPTFVKLGQFLSTRADLLPSEYIAALAGLQDEVAPLDGAVAVGIVERELGAPIGDLFTEFDPVPVASASLGQVHRARLADGRAVAVKVQRPGIEAVVRRDLAILRDLARVIERNSSLARLHDIRGLADEATRTVLDELDYRLEARNARQIAANLVDFDAIVVPEVVDRYTTRRVLTTTWADGVKLTADLPAGAATQGLADTLLRAYLKQMCVDGLFHGDPHPGNLLLWWGEGGQARLVLLDFGMVGRLGARLREHLVRLLLYLADGRGDLAAEVCVEIGERYPGFNERRFAREVTGIAGRFADLPVRDLNVGRALLDLVRVTHRYRLGLPVEVAMVGKAFLSLEGACRRLDPGLDPAATVKAYAGEMIRHRLLHDGLGRSPYAALLEGREYVADMPGLLRDVLRRVGRDEVALAVRIEHAEETVASLNRVANRIAFGIITGALIVGSALVMQVPGGVRLWGYPVVALVGFLLAAGLGVFLVARILLTDRR
ncbi:MAG TPA: AarF/ABC1/UbiB kinase family protein [Thermodesulfobacteriota bacterium]